MQALSKRVFQTHYNGVECENNLRQFGEEERRALDRPEVGHGDSKDLHSLLIQISTHQDRLVYNQHVWSCVAATSRCEFVCLLLLLPVEQASCCRRPRRPFLLCRLICNSQLGCCCCFSWLLLVIGRFGMMGEEWPG